MLAKYRGIPSGGAAVQSRGDLASQLVHDVMLCQWEGLRDSYRGLPSYDSCVPYRKRQREEVDDSTCNGQGTSETEGDLFLVSPREANWSPTAVTCSIHSELCAYPPQLQCYFAQ